mmetsp:Transcript_75689/g.202581  ORF Transcript_75689/g.202581 Transcript_75689/m.202581 type:complete len:103 (-) Transcript_75689:166-474(-)
MQREQETKNVAVQSWSQIASMLQIDIGDVETKVLMKREDFVFARREEFSQTQSDSSGISCAILLLASASVTGRAVRTTGTCRRCVSGGDTVPESMDCTECDV